MAELARERAKSAADAHRLHANEAQAASEHHAQAEKLHQEARARAEEARRNAERAGLAKDEGHHVVPPGGTHADPSKAVRSSAAQTAYEKALALRNRPANHQVPTGADHTGKVAKLGPATMSAAATARQAIRIAGTRSPRTPSPSTLEPLRTSAMAGLRPHQRALVAARVLKNKAHASTTGRPANLTSHAGSQPITRPASPAAAGQKTGAAGKQTRPLVTLAAANLGNAKATKGKSTKPKPGQTGGAVTTTTNGKTSTTGKPATTTTTTNGKTSTTGKPATTGKPTNNSGTTTINNQSGSALLIAGILAAEVGQALLLQGAFAGAGGGSAFGSGCAFIPNNDGGDASGGDDVAAVGGDAAGTDDQAGTDDALAAQTFDPDSSQSGVLLSVNGDPGDAGPAGTDGDPGPVGGPDGTDASSTASLPPLDLSSPPGSEPGGTDPGDTVSAVVFDQPAVALDAVPQNGRYLNLINLSRSKVTVYVQYHAVDQQNNWAWFPADPAMSDQALSFDLEPGQATETRDGDWRIFADKARVWAVSADGQQQWVRYQKRDLLLVPEVDDQGQPGYVAPTIETVDFGVK
jgi:hypothetical protein